MYQLRRHAVRDRERKKSMIKELQMKRVAVVTGGAGGIGQATAERLSQDNFAVVLLDLNTEAGNQVAGEFRKRSLEVSFFQVDLTQEIDVGAAFNSIIGSQGRIDALVNVAGGSLHRHPMEDFPLTHWRAVI